MSALQDSSHSREQSLDRKPTDVGQHRLVPQHYDVISNTKMKAMTPHQLLTQQNLATSVTIVSAALSVAPRVTLSPAILQQALSPRVVGSYVPSTASMSSHSPGSTGTVAAPRMVFHPQQQMAVNLSTSASSGTSVAYQLPTNQMLTSGQTLAHQGLYGIRSTIGARQIPMATPRMPVATPVLGGGVELAPRSITIPKVATIPDIRTQTTPHSTPGSHLPKGAIAAASMLNAPKTGHTAIARPVAPSAATAVQVQHPTPSNLVIQSSAAQPAKVVMQGGRGLPPLVTRPTLPTVSIVTTSTSRIPSISLQPQLPWSNSAAIQVPVMPAKSSLESGGAPLGNLSAANILHQTIRPVALATQQMAPLAIRAPAPAQKVLLSSSFTSLAPASMVHTPATIPSISRVTDNVANHSIAPATARPNLMPGTSLAVVSAAPGLLGGSGAAHVHPLSVAQSAPPKTHKVVLSKATLPVQSISVNKLGSAALPTAGMNLTRPKKNIRLHSAAASAVTHPSVASVALAPVVTKAGVPVVSVQAVANVGIKPLSNTTLPSSITAVPVAKVLPHAFTIQQLSGDGQSPATCRLVSPGSQPLPQQPPPQQQQQHPRPAVPPGSQIIPIQQNAVFLTSNCLSSTAIPAGALSIPVTSIDSRHSNEHGPVLHQVSYAIPDGTRYLTPQHLMSLSSAYPTLQPLTFQASNVRTGSVTSPAPALSVSLQGVSSAVTSLNSVVAMANQAGRLNAASVVVAMDTSRLALNFATGDVGSRAGEPPGNPFGVALNQGNLLQQQQPLQHQPQQTVIALMQPPQPSPSASADSVKQQTMSPRPPILRKRNHDLVMGSGAKKNLFSPMASSTNDLAGSNLASTADVSQLVLALPKSFDASRENSQSSTDTASSAESTPRSCPPSSTRVKEEPQDCFENGSTANDPGSKIIPRKKPRKQSLHANEEIPDGFSSEDDNAEPLLLNISLNAEMEPVDEEPEQKGLFAPTEYVDDEGFRWTRTRPKNITVTREYAWSSKSRSNHFISFADVKLKDERRSTVNELANTVGIQQAANGAKVNRLSDQFVQLIELETNTFDRMKTIQSEFPAKLSGKHLSGDEEVRSVGEIVLANVQRCRTYIDQLGEVRDLLSRMLHHKRQAFEIIAKHQSKRTVKKKERS